MSVTAAPRLNNFLSSHVWTTEEMARSAVFLVRGLPLPPLLRELGRGGGYANTSCHLPAA